jgi:cytochrome c-type biogenesis protein CcmH/NrfF
MALRRVHVRRLLLACAFALAVSPALANTASQHAATIARELMSPFCPGLLLADCQSSGAHDLRAEILSRLEAGETSRDIVDDLAARYGAGIRAQPAMQGVGAFAWVLPGVLGVASLLLLTRWVCTPAPLVPVPRQSGPTTIADDAMLARVDRELLTLD